MRHMRICMTALCAAALMGFAAERGAARTTNAEGGNAPGAQSQNEQNVQQNAKQASTESASAQKNVAKTAQQDHAEHQKQRSHAMKQMEMRERGDAQQDDAGKQSTRRSHVRRGRRGSKVTRKMGRPGQRYAVHGQVQSIRIIKLNQKRLPHVLVKLRLPDGRTAVLDLGTVRNIDRLKRARVKEGRRLAAVGVLGRINAKPVLVVQGIKTHDAAVRIARRQNAASKRVDRARQYDQRRGRQRYYGRRGYAQPKRYIRSRQRPDMSRMGRDSYRAGRRQMRRNRRSMQHAHQRLERGRWRWDPETDVWLLYY